MRRVVITGLGCVTPCGIGAAALWESLIAGRSGIGRVQAFDARGIGSQVAGEVREFDPTPFLAQREIQTFSRYMHFGVAAARMAWADALEGRGLDPDMVGVSVGSMGGHLHRIINEASVFAVHGLARVHPMLPIQYPGSLGCQVSMALGLHGPTYAIGTACTAGADAVGLGFLQIAAGTLDGCLVGGSEMPLIPSIFAALDRLGALSRLNDPPAAASRPFSRTRNGFVIAEGAGMLMLEAEDVARARGARIYAELAGFGATSDGVHHLAPAEDGIQGARAVRLALAQSGMAPSDVDYVNAHGTGTQKNDLAETRILKSVFGDHARRLPVSSSKSMLGHMIGAAGAVELIATTLALHHDLIPPTINLDEPDPECDLDYVPGGARAHRVRAAVSTSFGFGSRNAAIVLRKERPPDERKAT